MVEGAVLAISILDQGTILQGGEMVLELAIICIAAGAVLGLRFNVLVLVPAITVTVLFAVIAGIAHAQGFWSIAGMAALLVAAVQLGYLAGVALYAAVEAIRGLNRDRGPKLSAPLGATAWRPAGRSKS